MHLLTYIVDSELNVWSRQGEEELAWKSNPTSKQQQGGIRLGAAESKIDKEGAELVEPGSGSLFQSVDSLVETPNMIRFLLINEPGRLPHENFLMEISMSLSNQHLLPARYLLPPRET